MTVAVADAILNKNILELLFIVIAINIRKQDLEKVSRLDEVQTSKKPYGSYGNGSAMRVSSIGFAFDSIPEMMTLPKKLLSISHNHPDAIKGAQSNCSVHFFSA